MKERVLVGLLVAALSGGVAAAQSQGKATGAKATAEGHSTPNQQPGTAPAAVAPTGELALGAVTFSKSVKADGTVLAAGTYQVRLTAQTSNPEAKGQTQNLERWVEFVQGGKVKGREVASIVPQSEISNVQKDTPPRANSSKVETLKGGEYMRLWINKGGNHYLIHLPTA